MMHYRGVSITSGADGKSNLSLRSLHSVDPNLTYNENGFVNNSSILKSCSSIAPRHDFQVMNGQSPLGHNGEDYYIQEENISAKSGRSRKSMKSRNTSGKSSLNRSKSKSRSRRLGGTPSVRSAHSAISSMRNNKSMNKSNRSAVSRKSNLSKMSNRYAPNYNSRDAGRNSQNRSVTSKFGRKSSQPNRSHSKLAKNLTE